jgi:hypothetical protein
MLINRQAINSYLDRDFDNFLWMKRLTREAIMRELNSLKVKPTFKTEPWLHQLVCFYIGICNPRFLYLLDMGLGKALANDEQVLTPNGYVPMGALKVGDKVMGGNGEPADVIGVYPQGIKPLYAVTLSDGVTVRCCDDHLWDVRTPLQSRYETKPLREFRGTLRYAPSGKSEQGNLRWFIPVSPAINFENQEAPTYLHPYIVPCLGMVVWWELTAPSPSMKMMVPFCLKLKNCYQTALLACLQLGLAPRRPGRFVAMVGSSASLSNAKE